MATPPSVTNTTPQALDTEAYVWYSSSMEKYEYRYTTLGTRLGNRIAFEKSVFQVPFVPETAYKGGYVRFHSYQITIDRIGWLGNIGALHSGAGESFCSLTHIAWMVLYVL